MRRYIRKHSNLILLAVVAIAVASAIVLSKVSKGLPWFYLASPWTWTSSLGAVSSLPYSSHHAIDKRKHKEKEFINLEKILDAKSVMKRGKLRHERPEKVEASLARARALIREAILLNHPNNTSDLQDLDYVPGGNIYRNAHAFHRYKTIQWTGQGAAVLIKYQWLMLQRPAPI